MKDYTLVSLLFETGSNYNTNLQTLLNLVKQTQKNSLIVAPEVCLSGFDYDNFNEAISFYDEALEAIKKVSYEKIIILTMIQKINNEVFNVDRKSVV